MDTSVFKNLLRDLTVWIEIRNMPTWVYIGYLNQWIHSSIAGSNIYQVNFATPTLALFHLGTSWEVHEATMCESFLMLNLPLGSVRADDEVDVDGTVEEDLGKSREGSRTDDEVVQRFVFFWTYTYNPLGTWKAVASLYLFSKGPEVLWI